MKRTITILALLTVLVTSASATDEHDARMDRVLALHGRNTTEGLEPPAMPPMMAEIKAVLDSARAVETELRSGLAGDVVPPGSPLALTLAKHEKTTRLQVLRIQARYARLEGRAQLEQRILTSIAEIERPLAPNAPKMKPVSAPTAGTTNQR